MRNIIDVVRGFCFGCLLLFSSAAYGIQFPVSAFLEIDLNFSFGGSLSAEVTSQGFPDAIVELTGTNAEIERMQLGGLIGIAFVGDVPIEIRVGSGLGLPSSLGTFTGDAASFDVFFEAEVITPGITYRPFNTAPLVMAATFDPPATIPVPVGAIYNSQGPVDIFDANDNNELIGTIESLSFEVVADQDVPSLPSLLGPNGEFIFDDAVSGLWFDPPFVPGFRYTMLGDSLFTQILDFPVDFASDFEVVVDGVSLGSFGPGESVDFVALMGDGVNEFTVQGIEPLVDAADATAFPLQLAFNTATADFMMAAVPEPTCGLLMTLGGLGILLARRGCHASLA